MITDFQHSFTDRLAYISQDSVATFVRCCVCVRSCEVGYVGEHCEEEYVDDTLVP